MDSKGIELLVRKGLIDMIREARGTCLTFKPKKLAKRVGLSTKPVVLSVIRYYLDEMVEKGLLQVYKKTSHGITYIITNESPLWQQVKNGHL